MVGEMLGVYFIKLFFGALCMEPAFLKIRNG